jgi:NAD(P)-dependent dehydrogenase (short-subunit alcohol dehydrogenase family)
MTDQSQRVIVTAGADGIGLAIARCFLASGAQVHIGDINQSALDRAIAAESQLSGSLVDVGNPVDVRRLFAEAFAELGGLDVLVNNAGISGPIAAIEDTEVEAWDETIRINLNGMFYCLREAVPLFKAQRAGSVINISTASTRTGIPNRLPYIASKAGVEGLTTNAARELGPPSIRCNAILPGFIDNERGQRLIQHLADRDGVSYQEAFERSLRYYSMRCTVEMSEIGDMAVYLASYAGRHISGQLIAVDGYAEWEE